MIKETTHRARQTANGSNLWYQSELHIDNAVHVILRQYETALKNERSIRESIEYASSFTIVAHTFTYYLEDIVFHDSLWKTMLG